MVNIIVIGNKMDVPIHICIKYDIEITNKKQADVLVRCMTTAFATACGILSGKCIDNMSHLIQYLNDNVDIDGIRFYSDN